MQLPGSTGGTSHSGNGNAYANAKALMARIQASPKVDQSRRIGNILRQHRVRVADRHTHNFLDLQLTEQAGINLRAIFKDHRIRDISIHGRIPEEALIQILSEKNLLEDMQIINHRLIIDANPLEGILFYYGDLRGKVKMTGNRLVLRDIWLTRSAEAALRSLVRDNRIREIEISRDTEHFRIRRMFITAERIEEELLPHAMRGTIYLCQRNPNQYPEPTSFLTGFGNILTNLMHFRRALVVRGEAIVTYQKVFGRFLRANQGYLAGHLYREKAEIEDMDSRRIQGKLSPTEESSLEARKLRFDSSLETLIEILATIEDHSLATTLLDRLWETRRTKGSQGTPEDAVEIIVAIAQPLAERFPGEKYFHDDVATYRMLHEQGKVSKREYLRVATTYWEAHLAEREKLLPPLPKPAAGGQPRARGSKRKGRKGGGRAKKKAKGSKPKIPAEHQEHQKLEVALKAKKRELKEEERRASRRLVHAWGQVLSHKSPTYWTQMLVAMESGRGLAFLGGDKSRHLPGKISDSNTSRYELMKIFQVAEQKQIELLTTEGRLEADVDPRDTIFELLNNEEDQSLLALQLRGLEELKISALIELFDRMEKGNFKFWVQERAKVDIGQPKKGKDNGGVDYKDITTAKFMPGSIITGRLQADRQVTIDSEIAYFWLELAEQGHYYIVWNDELHQKATGKGTPLHLAIWHHHNMVKHSDRGDQFRLAHDHPEAIKAYELAQEAYPTFEQFRMALATSHVDIGNRLMGSAAITKALSGDTGMVEALEDEAKGAFEAGIKIWPQKPFALYHLAKIAEKRKDCRTQAKMHRRQIAAIDSEEVKRDIFINQEGLAPARASALGALGEVLLKICEEEGDRSLIPEAERHLHEALDNTHLFPGYAYNYMASLLLQEKFDEAIAFVEDVMNNPRNYGLEGGEIPEELVDKLPPEKMRYLLLLSNLTNSLLDSFRTSMDPAKYGAIFARIIPAIVTRLRSETSDEETKAAVCKNDHLVQAFIQLTTRASKIGLQVFSKQLIEHLLSLGLDEEAMLRAHYSQAGSLSGTQKKEGLEEARAPLAVILQAPKSSEIMVEGTHTGVSASLKDNAYNMLATCIKQLAELEETDEGRVRLQEEAEELLEGVVGEFPNSALLINTLATVKRDLGKIDEAEQYFRRSFEVNPHFLIGYTNLIHLFENHDRANEIPEVAKQAQTALAELLEDIERATLIVSAGVVQFILKLASSTNDPALLEMVDILKNVPMFKFQMFISANELLDEGTISEELHRRAISDTSGSPKETP